MGYFALLEAGINGLIGELLGVEGRRLAIVTRNMAFNEKIKTMRTLAKDNIFDISLVDEIDKLAKHANIYGETRNIVAHTPFRSSKISDGVEFFAVKAINKLEFPEIDWSIDDFLGWIDKINKADNRLRELEAAILSQRMNRAIISGFLGGP